MGVTSIYNVYNMHTSITRYSLPKDEGTHMYAHRACYDDDRDHSHDGPQISACDTFPLISDSCLEPFTMWHAFMVAKEIPLRMQRQAYAGFANWGQQFDVRGRTQRRATCNATRKLERFGRPTFKSSPEV
jgi:hypothetical protein